MLEEFSEREQITGKTIKDEKAGATVVTDGKTVQGTFMCWEGANVSPLPFAS